jgi:hypothetical protein
LGKKTSILRTVPDEKHVFLLFALQPHHGNPASRAPGVLSGILMGAGQTIQAAGTRGVFALFIPYAQCWKKHITDPLR